MRLPIVDASDVTSLASLYSGGWDPPREVREGVAAIIAAVRERGDAALVEYARRFDNPQASVERLRVAIPPVADAESLIPAEIAAGLRLARKRVADFHERQRPANVMVTDEDGTVNAFLYQALDSVGAYVPGGSATLPSSVIMTTTPAKLAGVRRIVVTTPAGRDGTINGAILFACSLCGVNELYAVGGAQAIAALAYGTATIAAVDKIVGPGNVWVTEAKRQVFGRCGIDGLAGPSEVLVVADATSKPQLVAGEMLAQAEHDPLARVATVSTERSLLEEVAVLLDGDFARETGRNDIIESVLAAHARLIYARSRADIIEVIARFAPEHLSLQTEDPWEFVPSIRNAGAIFVGEDTPVAAGDYIAGTNHVLPTSGAGRFASGLRTADFYRTTTLVENSRARMHADRDVLAALATFEGLPAHARTALLRE